ncbi:flavodoxin family protein [Methyloligella sp. 2.7D]|uniref:flavodoxin family protein n=1 Tax=unclassified Methyloligella TaxID=2625955 RepID=UPI00157CEAA8|nr:flavodoxin family protein [Methyloligella sp. GL2]QKP76311.1 flavodoxin family protein [Methyloligella sp. GL2]
MKAMILSASPRRDGNSAALAQAAARGIRQSGHEAELLYADEFLEGFLRDCRQCRREDGTCGIADGFGDVFLDHYLPAEGFIAATPIYWYGMSAQLKAFFDRAFCYVSASYPEADRVVNALMGKRIGLLLSSEETYPDVGAGIIHQIQEHSRYTNSTFVGHVHGIGNSRAEVARDPSQPLKRAEEFGERFFSAHTSDYRIDSERSGKVWGPSDGAHA